MVGRIREVPFRENPGQATQVRGKLGVNFEKGSRGEGGRGRSWGAGEGGGRGAREMVEEE